MKNWEGEALDKLAAKHPQQAEVVKFRYIVGMTVQEVAKVLGLSKDVAWNLSVHGRAWLRREMSKTQK